MKKIIDIIGIDTQSTLSEFGNKEHRVDYDKIIGVLVCPADVMNYSLSINDGEEIVIGTSIEYVSKIAPDKRFTIINKSVKKNDLVRISFRQSSDIDGNGMNAIGRIYLLVEKK